MSWILNRTTRPNIFGILARTCKFIKNIADEVVRLISDDIFEIFRTPLLQTPFQATPWKLICGALRDLVPFVQF